MEKNINSEENQRRESSFSPSDARSKTASAETSSISEKSRNKYLYTYNSFTEWQRNRHYSENFSENVFLAYFTEHSKILKPSTQWARYSMLRAVINSYHQIDISSYKNLGAYLKNQAKGFQSRKTKVFTVKEIQKFLTEAPDILYLCAKTVAIFGVAGACRSNEFCEILCTNVKLKKDVYLVEIPKTKNSVPRSFTINDKVANIVRKYAALRPVDVPTNRFFLNYQQGKCTVQPIGINKFRKTASQIATFLRLENPKQYTMHSFHRLSASALDNAGADGEKSNEDLDKTKHAHVSNTDKNMVTDAEENGFYSIDLEDVKIKTEIEENEEELDESQSRTNHIHESPALETDDSQNVSESFMEELGNASEELIFQDLNFKLNLKKLAQPLMKLRLNSCQEELRSKIQKTTAEMRKLHNQINFIEEVTNGSIELTELQKKGSSVILYIVSKYDENPVLAMENKNSVVFDETGTDQIVKMYEYLWNFNEDPWMNVGFRSKLIKEHEKKSKQLKKLEKITTQDLSEGLKQKVMNMCTKVINQIVV